MVPVWATCRSELRGRSGTLGLRELRAFGPDFRSVGRPKHVALYEHEAKSQVARLKGVPKQNVSDTEFFVHPCHRSLESDCVEPEAVRVPGTGVVPLEV